ncbi:MAG: bifunctional folylpolyglutamate synthase/dihydrofolate synthase [Bacteroidales bacterium]|jgi:dihydrofolate synthase/folylpolyglutamate synthase|nr:bifunctional folylpolyglutamate synthase/dihydrofolate synthase [Bacteroidales bacterium]
MTYKETTDYLFSQLPMYQRIGASAYKENLDNTIQLLAALNNPERTFKTIHVAGTNGKGSTSHMLASILQTAGYKTGLHTSPHLKDFRERIKINGVCIPKQQVMDFVEQNRMLFETIQPSFFEMSVGMTFDYFAKEKVDIAIIEVGMGGRLDSTNVISPLLSIITNISKDHTQFLGDTLDKIAREKGGIIKPKTPVVIGETNELTAPIFTEIAQRNQSEIVFADKLNNPYPDLICDLKGIYQQKNIRTVLAAIAQLQTHFHLSEEAIRKGFANVIKNTGLMGRWQILSENPLTVCDTGHNEDGIKQVLKQISLTPHHKLHAVFGVVNDKDVTKILSLLPKDATYYFCRANLPRALDANELHAQAKPFGLQGEAFSTVGEALDAAKKSAKPDDLIWVGGSTFVVAEVV